MKNSKLDKIRRFNSILAAKIEQQCGFITAEDLPAIVGIDRLMLILVRCNNGRFLTPAQDVSHFLTIIEEHHDLVNDLRKTDYVRDVSLPADPE